MAPALRIPAARQGHRLSDPAGNSLITPLRRGCGHSI